MVLPALRERHDLDALIQHLLRAETSAHAQELSKVALQALLAYRWPGNGYRQLPDPAHSRCALAENEEEIGLQHLPDDVLEDCDTPVESAPGTPQPQPKAGDTLQVSKLRAIKAAVEASGGNLSAAARSLGKEIGRATLYRKLKAMAEGYQLPSVET